jgi:enoyl-CoA hydratase/carnithine racemase
MKKFSKLMEVEIQRNPPAALLKYNRPHALNALTLNMIRTITPQLQQIESDPMIKLLIQQGEGRAFCAGGDVKKVIEAVSTPTVTLHDASAFFREEYQLNHLLGS